MFGLSLYWSEFLLGGFLEQLGFSGLLWLVDLKLWLPFNLIFCFFLLSFSRIFGFPFRLMFGVVNFGRNVYTKLLNVGLDLLAGQLFHSIPLYLIFQTAFQPSNFAFVIHRLVAAFSLLVRVRLSFFIESLAVFPISAHVAVGGQEVGAG